MTNFNIRNLLAAICLAPVFHSVAGQVCSSRTSSAQCTSPCSWQANQCIVASSCLAATTTCISKPSTATDCSAPCKPINGKCSYWYAPPVCLTTPTPAPKPDPATLCPIVNLNFTNVGNPMARYYGQSATGFQAGEYLFDQLWWTHGVKVSARIRSTSHKTLHTDFFIPKFNRSIGWVDSKADQNPSDHTTGGAIRLFDTLRPNWNTNVNFRQPLCDAQLKGPNGQANQGGDTDLGAPNEKCPVPGPGKFDDTIFVSLRH